MPLTPINEKLERVRKAIAKIANPAKRAAMEGDRRLQREWR